MSRKRLDHGSSGADSNQKGRNAEHAVELALKNLKKQGLILHYIYAQPGRQVDGEGIDFLVQIRGGLCIPLQCKTNAKDVLNFLNLHPNIPFVILIGVGQFEAARLELGEGWQADAAAHRLSRLIDAGRGQLNVRVEIVDKDVCAQRAGEAFEALVKDIEGVILNMTYECF